MPPRPPPPLPASFSPARYRSRISFRSRLRWSRSDKYFKTAARPRRSSTVPSSPVARLNFRTIVETRVPRTTREFNFPASERVGRVGGAERELIHDLLTNHLLLGYTTVSPDVPFHTSSSLSRASFDVRSGKRPRLILCEALERYSDIECVVPIMPFRFESPTLNVLKRKRDNETLRI